MPRLEIRLFCDTGRVIFSTMLVDIQRRTAYRLSLIGMHKHGVADVLCRVRPVHRLDSWR
jgi:hypothetical protein